MHWMKTAVIAQTLMNATIHKLVNMVLVLTPKEDMSVNVLMDLNCHQPEMDAWILGWVLVLPIPQ